MIRFINFVFRYLAFKFIFVTFIVFTIYLMIVILEIYKLIIDQNDIFEKIMLVG